MKNDSPRRRSAECCQNRASPLGSLGHPQSRAALFLRIGDKNAPEGPDLPC